MMNNFYLVNPFRKGQTIPGKMRIAQETKSSNKLFTLFN